MRLLLLSNSTAPGRKYLEHVMDALSDVLADVRRLVFVPFALADHDGYTAQVATALSPLGIEVVGAHVADVGSGEAIFVGGGNTFRLLRALHVRGLLPVIRRRVVVDDVVYIGSSAGTNVACPSIRTTNDMPIVQPPTFEALFRREYPRVVAIAHRVVADGDEAEDVAQDVFVSFYRKHPAEAAYAAPWC